MKPIKKAVLLHDLCGVGKAALTNMLPVLSVMGIEACPVPTMLLSTHTGGYGKPAIEQVSAAYIMSCAEHYKEQQVSFDAIFVGYLGSADLVEAVSYFLSCFPETLVLFDPIMGDYGRYYSNFDNSYMEALKCLIPYADILLPNYTEFCFLTNHLYEPIAAKESVKAMRAQLPTKKSAVVIITSVPSAATDKQVMICHETELEVLNLDTIEGNFHGSGDVFDGVYLGSILNGLTQKEAVLKAHEFVCQCIHDSKKYNYDRREGLMIEHLLKSLV